MIFCTNSHKETGNATFIILLLFFCPIIRDENWLRNYEEQDKCDKFFGAVAKTLGSFPL